jgi:hypothetical protein|uniref:Uncharacterized protein n=1 Tax=Haptolina ericina TaxID=156174 RepID=A0A7S3FJZ3_9EUKA
MSNWTVGAVFTLLSELYPSEAVLVLCAVLPWMYATAALIRLVEKGDGGGTVSCSSREVSILSGIAIDLRAEVSTLRAEVSALREVAQLHASPPTTSCAQGCSKPTSLRVGSDAVTPSPSTPSQPPRCACAISEQPLDHTLEAPTVVLSAAETEAQVSVGGARYWRSAVVAPQPPPAYAQRG